MRDSEEGKTKTAKNSDLQSYGIAPLIPGTGLLKI